VLKILKYKLPFIFDIFKFLFLSPILVNRFSRLLLFCLISINSLSQATLPTSKTAWAAAGTGWTLTSMAQRSSSSACSGSDATIFDATNDRAQVFFDSDPDILTFQLKKQSTSGTSYVTVESSPDGSTWTTLGLYGTSVTPASTSITDCGNINISLACGVRYVRWTYTKGSGNIDMDDVSITKKAAGGCACIAASEPTTQASGISATPGCTSATINFTRSTTATNSLIVVSTDDCSGASFSDPSDVTDYVANTIYGSGGLVGTNERVVFKSTGNSVTVTGLNTNTTYYYRIYSYNGTTANCTENYLLGPACNSFTTTAAAEPTTQTTSITSTPSCTSVTINFTRSTTATNSLVVLSTDDCSGGSFTDPSDITNYTANTFYASGGTVGANEKVVFSGTGNSVTVTGLTSGVTYYYKIYPYNGTTTNCDENYLLGASCNSFTTGPTTEPVAQATGITATPTCSGVTINWTKPASATNSLVVISTDDCSGINFSNPTDQTDYTASTTYGSGGLVGPNERVVYKSTASSVAVTGLTAGTTYYYRIYAYNGTTANCNENYLLGPACNSFFTGPLAEPTTQASGISVSPNCTSAVINFTGGNGTNSVVVMSTDCTITDPTDQTSYTANATFGSGTSTGAGDFVVYKGSGSSVTVTGLTNGTNYCFKIFEQNGTTANCNENYLTTAVSTSFTTGVSTEPTIQASSITTSPDCTSALITFTGGNGTNNIIVMSTDCTITDPADQTNYTANATFGSGSTTAAGDFVIYNGTGSSVTVTGLTAGTSYCYKIYEYNGTTLNCNENYFLGPASNSFTTNTGCSTSAAGCLIINEFCVDPQDPAVNGGATGTNGEWVEIKNICDHSIDVGCFVLCLTSANANSGATDRNGECYTIPSGTTIAAGDVYVFGGSGTIGTGSNWPAGNVEFNWHSNVSNVWDVDVDAFASSTSGVGVINDGGAGVRTEDITLFDNTGAFIEGVTFSTNGLYAANSTENIPAVSGCGAKSVTIPPSASHTNVGSNSSGQTTDEGYGRDCLGNWVFRTFSIQTMGTDPLGACILPIELTVFDINCTENKLVFYWSTMSERNNDFFTLEESFDGIYFYPIMKVNGAGNSSTQKDYSSEIINDHQNKYYRLKQTDFDGEFSYSKIISSNCLNKESLFAFPNPGNGLFNIVGYENNSILTVHDELGRLIIKQETTKEITKINLDNLATGIYFITSTSEFTTETIKINLVH
jgi:hypothetical protein